MPVCDHPSADGSPCFRPIPEGSDHCFIHSDGGVPESHGAPEGNDNSVGNSGGSAPEGNGRGHRFGG